MSTAEKGRVSQSVQHRCPRMREHYRGGCACHPKLPIPCPDCYSVRVVSEVIPYRPDERWRVVSPPGRSDVQEPPC
jgi:hypothetical protein